MNLGNHSEDKYRKAFLRKQKSAARKHRRYMDMRRRKNTESTPSSARDFSVDTKPKLDVSDLAVSFLVGTVSIYRNTKKTMQGQYRFLKNGLSHKIASSKNTYLHIRNEYKKKKYLQQQELQREREELLKREKEKSFLSQKERQLKEEEYEQKKIEQEALQREIDIKEKQIQEQEAYYAQKQKQERLKREQLQNEIALEEQRIRDQERLQKKREKQLRAETLKVQKEKARQEKKDLRLRLRTEKKREKQLRAEMLRAEKLKKEKEVYLVESEPSSDDMVMKKTKTSATKGLNTKRTFRKKKGSRAKKSGKRSWLVKIFLFLASIFLLFAGFAFIWFIGLEIPDVENFENRKISNSTKIYDKTGEILLYDIHDNIRRTVVDSENISQHAKNAIVAIEDHTFYEHNGVVWKSTFRAVLQTLFSKAGLSSAGTAGGSTLTQQVIKNTLLNRDRVISRKVKEWVLAYKIEKKLSKDKILEIYLNEAPYGGTIYGIQEASNRFFGISASELSPAQAAYLAAIPNLPTYYSPYGKNLKELGERQKTVLREMKRYGFLSDVQYRQALTEEVEFLPQDDSFAKSLHFVQYVRSELEKKYGVDMVENGGLQVVTTLDYELQKKAESIIKEHIEEVEEEFNASNAALVAIESSTGHILSMVGSRDYFDTDDFDGNFNVALAPRQPGSSFKPFAYVSAFEKGYLPESTIFDTQTQFNARCAPDETKNQDGCYSPNNYDFKFKGPLTFREALAESRNIPAIKINYLAGVSNVIQRAKDLGISSLNKSADFYGLGLVLGGGEVSLFEMTSAYTAFSNDGVYNKPTGILEVRDVKGQVIDAYVNNESRVIEKNAVRMLNSILSDNEARSPLFGRQSFLHFGDRDVAGKTGTTNDNRDAWLIGYTPDVAVGVWTGNNDNSSMKKGSSISGKPWRRYMDEIIQGYSKSSFLDYSLPDNFDQLPNMIRGDWFGGDSYVIDTVSGKLATEFTPQETRLTVPQPDPHTILHWINKQNPLVPNTTRNDGQYKNWEHSVAKYTRENLSAILGFNIQKPTEYDDVHGPNGEIILDEEDDFSFRIRGIDDGRVYSLDDPIDISLRFRDRDEDEIEKAQFFINNAFVGSIESEPFEFSFVPSELQYFEEENILRISVTDIDGTTIINEENFVLDFG